ncbi:hypothetical protein INS49_002474 [Diaporthe citri]|uniref:uncharacterized protein n=1 Tax=Diaporthe citri TaxID=83186 RepID=UPI001C7E7383|nr:uncharacterized protein INS49_002474 [Diaporthe citri]KAG6368271.1 hypothetical protein INS49_002474 [Diaporthe citri]
MEDIRRLVGPLNIIFNIAQLPGGGSYVDQYERQKEIHDIVNAKRPSYDRLVSLLYFRSPDSMESWLDLQQEMERLTDKYEYQNGILDDEIEASKMPKDLKPPDDDSCQFVSNAFGAALCDRKPKPTSLCIMTNCDPGGNPELQWHELEVSTGKGDKTIPPDCICDYLKNRGPSYYQLNLILTENVLIRSPHRADKATLKPESLRGQIDLKALIAIKEKEWGLDIKWALAILLTYSLLYLHGGYNIKSLWQHENILFFLDGSGVLPLRPFLGNSAHAPKVTANPDKCHDDPPILMLGVMLLEIFLGESLESFLEKKAIEPGKTLYLRALGAFDQPEFFCFPPQFRLAIRACLSPATFANVKDDNKAMRLEFFNRIIAPLEAAAWEHFTTLNPGNPDEAAAAAFNLARGVDQALLHSFSYKSNLEGHPHARLVRHAGDAIREERSSNVATFTANENDAIGLLSDMEPLKEDSKASDHWQDWQNWFQNFKRFRNRIFDRIPPNDGNRPKVTVIDTGIDASHPFIRSTRWSSYDDIEDQHQFRDFSGDGEHEPVDYDGHGTFVAGLLLELAPDVQLTVARIGKSRTTIMTDARIAQKIIEALDHAIQIWKTEIISMSFGLTNRSPELQTAIETAISNGVIILAAAGNHGNNKSMHYPAKHKDVFKCLATGRYGTVKGFSAIPDHDASSYSFATIGYRIVSTWPLHLRQQAEDEKFEIFCWDAKKSRPNSACEHAGKECDMRVVMSGTSFATPIVAAHVALLYQFYEVNRAGEYAVEL